MIFLRRWWMRFVAVVVWVVGFVVLVFLYFRVVAPLFDSAWFSGFEQWVLFWFPGVGEITLGELFATVLSVLWLYGGPSLLAIVTRDWMLSRALREHIRGARCPACRQSLIGLPIEPDGTEDGDGARTRCPECGGVWVLRDLGLTPADLRPGAGPLGG